MEHAKLNSPIKIIEHLAIRKNFYQKVLKKETGESLTTLPCGWAQFTILCLI